MTAEKTAQKVVFLVDDELDFLEIFGAKLSAAGFTVVPYQNPQNAIDDAPNRHPDLVILDVQMPQMSGIQVLQKLKANPQTENYKVIFLTNSGTSEEGMEWLDQKFAKDVGALDHIRKSDDLDAITSRIKKILEQ